MTVVSRRAARSARDTGGGAWLFVAPAVAISTWGGNHFTPLLLLYRQVSGFSTVQVDLLLVSYLVGLVPGFLLSGPFSDRHGRKRILVAGLAISALASIVLAAGAGTLPLLLLGRLLAGLSVAIAMTVGSSWIKELSGAGSVHALVGARRASITITLGLGVGAGVSGCLAQWGPMPTVLPYAIQVALVVVAAVLLARAPGSPRRPGHGRARRLDLRIPRASRSRFVSVVVPVAPWVFTAAAIAYVVLPSLVSTRVGADRIAFATLLTVVTLGAGTGVQTQVGRLERLSRGHASQIGLVATIVGLVIAALDARTLSPAVAVLAAVVLGSGYGLLQVTGLRETQRLAPPEKMAEMTGLYFSLTYVGFVVPVVLAALSVTVSYPALLLILAILAIVCGVTSFRGERRGRRGDSADPDPALR